MLWWVALFPVVVANIVATEIPLGQSNQIRRGLTLPIRAKRSSVEHLVQECVMVTSEEGHFYHKSVGGENPQACGVFLVADPGKFVEVHFDFLDVPCGGGNLVSFVDGWEMNGQFFPSVEDHPKALNQRFQEFCGSQAPKRVFLSSQNAALIQYFVTKRGRGFSFHVRHIRNPTPCNILIESTSDMYTLRNYGKHVNCSLTAVYPAQVRVLQLGVGFGTAFSKRNEVETGTIHKCDKRGMSDFVQLGGSDGLDLSSYNVVDSICGMDSLPEHAETIFCGVTTVRLVSSGDYDNAVTLQLRQATENDILRASLICGL